MKTTQKEKIAFIKDFPVHYTANSWNRGDGFSIRCKYHDLSLSQSEQNTFLDIISDENLSLDFYDTINNEIEYWQEETATKYGYSIVEEDKRFYLSHNDERQKNGQKYEWKKVKVKKFRQNVFFAGRSGGYLVISENLSIEIKQNIDFDNKEEVNYYFNLLNDFTLLFNTLRVITKDFCNRKITEETISIPKTIKTFKQDE